MVTLALVAAVALVVLNVMPAYLEYFAIRHTIDRLAHGPELRGASVRDIQSAFDNHARVDNIVSVNGQDLDVLKTSDGFSISVSYGRKVPLLANISVCLDFSVSSK